MEERSESTSQKAKRRSSSMADRMVQGQLLCRTALHWAIFISFSTALTVVVGVFSADPGWTISKAVSVSLGNVLWPTVILVALLPAFLVDTLRLSSRFVGPMVRLRRSLQNLGFLGTADRISFRGNDFWRQSADDFNAVLDLVQSQKERIEQLELQLKEQENSTTKHPSVSKNLTQDESRKQELSAQQGSV